MKGAPSQSLDQPAAARPGEELSIGRLRGFLEEAIPGGGGELEVLQYPAGHSNLTYLVRWRDRELVLRRPPVGRKPRSGHDMKREYTVLTALRDSFPYCPETVALCDDESILGAPFYLMERLRGVVIRRDPPPGLRLDGETFRRLCERMVDVLVELHSLDHRELGLADFGRPDGYVERQVLGWAKRYRKAKTPDVPDYEEVMAWLAEKMPSASQRACIIHNDYKLDNVVLDPQDPTRIIGVLDWEMATVGDPLMDLGEVLAYWIQRDDPPGLQALRMVASHLDGALTRAEIAERYTAGTGLDLSGLDFYYTFGLFRIAVISQQIYYRYYYGQSHDLRFGMFGHSVSALDRVCREIIQKSDL